MRRPPAKPPPADGALGQFLELLQHRRAALRHEWALESVAPLTDDDLLPVRSRIEESMLQVSMALERARQGRLGHCARCGAGIDFERLLAHPSASLCWPCQEAAERDGASSGPH